MTRYVKLEEGLNPEYYAFVKEYNDLMRRWDELNSQVHQYNKPEILATIDQKNLSALDQNLKDLQKKFLEWNKKVRNFALKPNYKFSEETEKGLSFLHFTINLLDLRSNFDSYITLVENNFNTLVSEVRYAKSEKKLRRDFRIAITSAVFSFLGWALTLYQLLK